MRGFSVGWISRNLARVLPALVVGCCLALVGASNGAALRHPVHHRFTTPADLIPPLGLPVNTIGPDFAARIGDRTFSSRPLRLLAVNRTTLAVKEYEYANRPFAFDILATDIAKLDSSWLVMVIAPEGIHVDGPGDVEAFNNKVVKAIGGAPISGGGLPAMSLVGVPGWDVGTAYENVGQFMAVGKDGTREGALVGYLQRNPESGAVGFTFGDYPEVNTDANPDERAQNLNTIRVGTHDYFAGLRSGESGFHVVTVDASSLATRQNRTFATNGTNNDRYFQGQLADNLAEVPAHTLVVVQSVGSPHPTTEAWNGISRAFRKLGGLTTSIDRSGDHNRYALIGGEGIAARAVESVNDADALQDGTIAGVLARDRDSQYAPILSDPQGSAVGAQLLELAYAPPSAWPDRNTTGLRAAMSYIATQLDLRVADPYLAYDDHLIAFDSSPYYGKLQTLSYPGGTAFTQDEFDHAKQELLLEFVWVTKVRSFTKELHDLLVESVIIKQGELADIARNIKDRSGAGGATTSVSAYGIYADLFTVGLGLGVPGAGAISGLFKVAGALTKDKGQDILGNFNTSTGDLGSELVTRFKDGLTSLSLVESILVGDYNKLKTAGQDVIDGKPGWTWTSRTTPLVLRALTLSAKRYFSQKLIAVVYKTNVLPGDFQNPNDCRVLGGEPSSAWLTHVDAFNADGRPSQTSAWAIGKRQEDDRYGRMKADAGLIDPLFKPVSPDNTDNLGLSKPAFIEKTLGAPQGINRHYCVQLVRVPAPASPTPTSGLG
jgi:hypothetical protein